MYGLCVCFVYPLTLLVIKPSNKLEASKRERKYTTKRELLEQEAHDKAETKKQKLEAKELTQKAKARTEGKVSKVPEPIYGPSG
jgi:hypothetical protein